MTAGTCENEQPSGVQKETYITMKNEKLKKFLTQCGVWALCLVLFILFAAAVIWLMNIILRRETPDLMANACELGFLAWAVVLAQNLFLKRRERKQEEKEKKR